MRNLLLLIAFLTNLVLCQAAHAAPIPGDSPQVQLALNSAPHPFQINYATNRNTAPEVPNLFSGTQTFATTASGMDRTAEYLPSGSGTFRILANSAAPLPEPPTLLLLGTGILALAVIWRLRRSKA